MLSRTTQPSEVLYRKGILNESASPYQLLKFKTWKEWDLGLLSEFWYEVAGGSFFDSKAMRKHPTFICQM